MGIALVVVTPFADYVQGDRITDADKVKKILETNGHHVVRVSTDDEHREEQAAEPREHS